MSEQKRTDIDFNEFRKLLEAERKRIGGLHRNQVAEMRHEMEDASENELSHTSTFDSAENEDTAAMMADRDRDAAQDENLVHELNHIEHALARLEKGTYGICERTGQPIPLERLRALPWATTTVEAAERYE